LLPKFERLKINSEFKAAYRLKNSVADTLFILYAGKAKTSPEYPTKVGFVVSKKIHKRATKRNRIKRLFREAYRNARKNNDIKESQQWRSLIFIARGAALDTNYKEVYDAIIKNIKRLDKKFGKTT